MISVTTTAQADRRTISTDKVDPFGVMLWFYVILFLLFIGNWIYSDVKTSIEMKRKHIAMQEYHERVKVYDIMVKGCYTDWKASGFEVRFPPDNSEQMLDCVANLEKPEPLSEENLSD